MTIGGRVVESLVSRKEVGTVEGAMAPELAVFVCVERETKNSVSGEISQSVRFLRASKMQQL
jgi:hypothetical protein